MGKAKRTCNYPLCEERPTAMGMCNTHYIRWKRVDDALSSRKGEATCAPVDFHCVYVMVMGDMPYCKIGRSRDPLARKDSLQSGNPFEVTLAWMEFSYPEIIYALEYETIKCLKGLDCHVRGEWFNIMPEDAIAVIRKCADIYGYDVTPPEKHLANIQYQDTSKQFSKRTDSLLRALKAVGVGT